MARYTPVDSLISPRPSAHAPTDAARAVAEDRWTGGRDLALRAAALPDWGPFASVWIRGEDDQVEVVVRGALIADLASLRAQLSAPAALGFAWHLAAALAEAHARGQAHGALHPRGVGLSEAGRLCLRPALGRPAPADPDPDASAIATDCLALGALLEQLDLGRLNDPNLALILRGLRRSSARLRLQPGRAARQALAAVLARHPEAERALVDELGPAWRLARWPASWGPEAGEAPAPAPPLPPAPAPAPAPAPPPPPAPAPPAPEPLPRLPLLVEETDEVEEPPLAEPEPELVLDPEEAEQAEEIGFAEEELQIEPAAEVQLRLVPADEGPKRPLKRASPARGRRWRLRPAPRAAADLPSRPLAFAQPLKPTPEPDPEPDPDARRAEPLLRAPDPPPADRPDLDAEPEPEPEPEPQPEPLPEPQPEPDPLPAKSFLHSLFAAFHLRFRARPPVEPLDEDPADDAPDEPPPTPHELENVPDFPALPTPPDEPEPPPAPEEPPEDLDFRPVQPGDAGAPRWTGARGVTFDSRREEELGAGKWTETGRSAAELSAGLPQGPTRELDLGPPGSSLPWGLILALTLALALLALLVWQGL